MDALDLISPEVATHTEAMSMGAASGLSVDDDADNAYFAARAEASIRGQTPVS